MCILHIMLDLLDSLLGPLARILVRRGVPFPDFAERMKAHYLRAAELQSDGNATDSRVSVLTGLQRRDVARLRSYEPKPERPNHLVTLVARWQTEPGYQGFTKPLVLPKNGPAPSFEALATSIRKDIHARTMLDALEEAGTVDVNDEAQTVTLLKTSYQPLAGSDDQIAYLADNLGDHISAATENVLTDSPQHFERAVHYAGLNAESIAKLDATYQHRQMEVFEELSRMAADMKTENQGGHRFRAGGYFYTVETS